MYVWRIRFTSTARARVSLLVYSAYARRIPTLRPSCKQTVSNDALYFQIGLDPCPLIMKYSFGILTTRNTWFSSLPEGSKTSYIFRGATSTHIKESIPNQSKRADPSHLVIQSHNLTLNDCEDMKMSDDIHFSLASKANLTKKIVKNIYCV